MKFQGSLGFTSASSTALLLRRERRLRLVPPRHRACPPEAAPAVVPAVHVLKPSARVTAIQRALYLYFINSYSEGAQHLAAAIPLTRSLNTMWLSRTAIGDEGT